MKTYLIKEGHEEKIFCEQSDISNIFFWHPTALIAHFCQNRKIIKNFLQIFKSIRNIFCIISFPRKHFLFVRIMILSPISISLIKFVKGVNNLESFELQQFNSNTCSQQSLEQAPNPKKNLKSMSVTPLSFPTHDCSTHNILLSLFHFSFLLIFCSHSLPVFPVNQTIRRRNKQREKDLMYLEE